MRISSPWPSRGKVFAVGNTPLAAQAYGYRATLNTYRRTLIHVSCGWRLLPNTNDGLNVVRGCVTDCYHKTNGSLPSAQCERNEKQHTNTSIQHHIDDPTG